MFVSFARKRAFLASIILKLWDGQQNLYPLDLFAQLMKKSLTVLRPNFFSYVLYTLTSAGQPHSCRYLKLGFQHFYNSKGVLRTTFIGLYLTHIHQFLEFYSTRIIRDYSYLSYSKPYSLMFGFFYLLYHFNMISFALCIVQQCLLIIETQQQAWSLF